MKAIHIIAGLSPKNGGPSYSVPRLCVTLNRNGCQTELLSLHEAGSPAHDKATYFRQDAASLPVLSSLRLSGALRRGLEGRVFEADIVHNHGLWLMPNVYAGHAARKSRRRLVVSPRGMLAEAALKFSPIKKKVFWAALQRRAVVGATVWHATSGEEADDIRAFGIKAPVAIIPNGIDIPDYFAKHEDNCSQRTLLFMSRLHPKKGVTSLIEAWSRLQSDQPEWRLIIAGPDQGGYRAKFEDQARRAGCQRITFTGAVYGEEKSNLLQQADLFVLPTQNENFGLVVAEALASGTPAIVTRGAPWQGLETEGCGWWIDQGVEPLLAALREATLLPAGQRRQMGIRGRCWMARDFGWDAIGQQMLSLYEWSCGSGELPNFVRTE